jgi:hypothetical protein
MPAPNPHVQDAHWQLEQQRALHVTWARERAGLQARIAALTSGVGPGSPGHEAQAHWVELTDRLTDELIGVTDRLEVRREGEDRVLMTV